MEEVMPIQQLTPQDVQTILSGQTHALYVDVRSVPEFEKGHPAGAINIPLLHMKDGGLALNADFQRVASAVLPKDKKLLIGCQAGGRSQKACMILEQLGFSDLANVMGGFGGGQNPATGAPVKGWKDSGLPVSQENGDGVSYESLAAKVK
jgi:rhodanese-related sulfurtransferase